MNQHPTKRSRNANIVRMRLIYQHTWRQIAEAHDISIGSARAVVDRYSRRVLAGNISARYGTPNEDRK